MRLAKVLIGMGHTARHAYAEFITAFCLSRQIRQLRIARGWSRPELARKSGLTVPTIWRLETYIGCLHVRISSLCAIAAAFDVALIVQFVSWGEWVAFYITREGIRSNFPVPTPFHLTGCTVPNK
jgi:transcriptional regulator with XRE-family HTH domain